MRRSRMPGSGGLAVLALIVMVATARAQAPPRDDAEACAPDIHRLCDRFFPDPKLVATCLVDRRSDLSVACAEVLARPAADTPKRTDRAE